MKEKPEYVTASDPMITECHRLLINARYLYAEAHAQAERGGSQKRR